MARRVEKLLVLGLDVGDAGLIEAWAREGRLPALASLMDRGDWARIETTADLLHVSAWPSIYTGAPPGEHGVYYTAQPVPGEQGYRKFHRGLYGRPTFWNLLSRNGVRCSVLDAPYTHPEAESRALQVFDWGTWARYWGRSSTPGSLIRRLDRACGRYPLGLEALDVGLGPLDPQDLEGPLRESVRAKADATRWLLRQHEWDVSVSVFAETHLGAHYFWRSSEEGDLSRLAALYQEIDDAIGSIVDAAGPDVSLMIVSGDGAGPNRAGWHLLPDVLRRLGHLAEPPEEGAAAGDDRATDDGRVKPIRDPVRLLRDALPKDFRKALARRLPGGLRDRLARRVDMAAVDWSRTRAFCLPTDLEGYVRINLAGREPQGIVTPGEEYERLCDDIVAAMEELVDPATGRRVVRQVVRSDAAFPGARRDHLPDLVVIWDRSAKFDRISSPAVGTVAGESPDARPGTHAPPGFVLSCAASSDHEPAAIAGVMDVAPHILARFRVPIPEYMSRDLPGNPAVHQGGSA